MDCSQPWTCTVHGLRRNILRCVPICLFTLPQLLEKWFPLQGERAHSQTPISIQIKSKSNLIHFFSFFLCLQGQPELCGSYHLLQSCFSFFVHLHGQPFGSYHLLQSCFSFFVRLHGQPEPFGSCIILQSCSSFFFCLHGQPRVFASDHLLQS